MAKKLGLRIEEIIFIYCPHFPTPHTPHPTPHTPHPTPHTPEKAYSAIQANKNETFALRISPDW
ncbi:MAG: hypothetical protein IM507_04055 [Microcystis sp. M20BS1]|nr:hypothetical protein [Microcystis sp. M20BS1]